MIEKLSQNILADAHFLASPHYDERPQGVSPDLLVIHCISLPPSEFGHCYVEDFFLGKLDADQHPYFLEIASMRVSAHIYIKRDGTLIQFVPLNKRAWHAGLSEFEGRNKCNDFSIGIELEGDVESPYTEKQYACLVTVTQQIQRCYPAITKQRITGHSDIAPSRKQDPGSGFDWDYYLDQL